MATKVKKQPKIYKEKLRIELDIIGHRKLTRLDKKKIEAVLQLLVHHVADELEIAKLKRGKR